MEVHNRIIQLNSEDIVYLKSRRLGLLANSLFLKPISVNYCADTKSLEIKQRKLENDNNSVQTFTISHDETTNFYIEW